jgi:hypothetical protein
MGDLERVGKVDSSAERPVNQYNRHNATGAFDRT